MSTAPRAQALTWDGAIWPVAKLPPAARSFLKQVRGNEIRICWVPRLKGGNEVLCAPFATVDGKRLAYRMVSSRPFADVLGAVYRPGAARARITRSR